MEMEEGGGNEAESETVRRALASPAWMWTCARVAVCVLCVCVFMTVRYVCLRGHQCDRAAAWLPGAIFSLCVLVFCVQTQLWFITRHSQLMITQHLFCPRSTLFCTYYQPESLRRIRRRALSNTLLLPLQLFSPWLGAAEDTTARISSRLRSQQTTRRPSSPRSIP